MALQKWSHMGKLNIPPSQTKNVTSSMYPTQKQGMLGPTGPILQSKRGRHGPSICKSHHHKVAPPRSHGSTGMLHEAAVSNNCR
eukprot:15048425-Ditylum_brightwellii.AAC.1